MAGTIGAPSVGAPYASFSYSNPSAMAAGQFSGSSGPQELKSTFGPGNGTPPASTTSIGSTFSPQTLATPGGAGLSLGTSTPTSGVSYGYTSSGGSLGSGASMIASTFSVTV